MGAYAAALLLTLAVEVPIYAVLLARVLPWPRAVAVGVLVNVVSHPPAFLVAFPLAEPLVGETVGLVVVEIGVLVLEAAIVVRWLRSAPVALAASALANLTSLAVAALLA